MDKPSSAATNKSQDLFERFSYLRAAYRKHQLKDVERPLARYKILAFSLSQQVNKKPGQPVDPLVAPDDDHSPSCNNCGKPFSQQRRGIPCTICGKRICQVGCTEKVLIKDELNETNTQRVDACPSCFKLLEWHRHKSELKERNAKAQTSAFCKLLRIVIESRDAIKEQLPKLRELMSIPPNEITLEEWEHAKELETSISEYFSAIDIGSKKIASVQFPHQRGKTVLNNYKSAMLTFLQSHSPDFLILQKDLKTVPKPPRDRQPRAAIKVIAVDPTTATGAPVLSSIDPIVHPVAGGRMTVTGFNFKTNITATFVGPTVTRNGEVNFLSASKIVVWGPPLPSAKAELNDIIIYSDEPFRNALSPSVPAPPEPEWASELKAKERELLVVEEEKRRREREAEEAEKKRRAAAASVPKPPAELSEEAKRKLEEEKRREARKNWGKAT